MCMLAWEEGTSEGSEGLVGVEANLVCESELLRQTSTSSVLGGS